MFDICSAIEKLQVISFSYDGFPRIVEPHTFGVDRKGHMALRGFQSAGRSESGELGWKLFHAEKMRGVEIHQETFEGPRRGYKRGDRAFSTIRCQL